MINRQQTDIIKGFLQTEGFTNHDLIDDLVDHMATEIESLISLGLPFDKAFEEARKQTLPDRASTLETDLNYLTTKKSSTMFRKIAYFGGYLSTVLLCISMIFLYNSTFTEKRIERFQYSLTQTFPLTQEELSDHMTEAHVRIMAQSYKDIEKSQDLFMYAFIVLIITFIPYQFYSRYKKSQLELAT